MTFSNCTRVSRSHIIIIASLPEQLTSMQLQRLKVLGKIFRHLENLGLALCKLLSLLSINYVNIAWMKICGEQSHSAIARKRWKQ